MIFIFDLLVNAAFTAIFFTFQKKNLHALEILIAWIVSSMIFQNYSAFFSMNIKHFQLPNSLGLGLANLLNRTILIPVITLIFLNQYFRLTSLKKKTAAILLIIMVCAGFEGMSHVTGILIHRYWPIWWSFAFWVVYISIFLLFLKFFRKKLRKVVRPS